MYKILITRQLEPSVMQKLAETCEVDVWGDDSAIPHDELVKRAQGKNGILCMLTDAIDKEVLDAAGNDLKAVSTMSVGYDHIDIAECHTRGVAVGYTPDALNGSVADLTIALMLSAGRRMSEAEHAVKTGAWGTWRPYWMTGVDLYGSTVGVVGLGRIAVDVIKRLKGFNCTVMYFSRTRKPEIEQELGIRYADLDVLLSQSDFVTVHAPLAPDTKEMFNAESFSKMKPSAVFVNTSRGGLVDQTALYDALSNKTIYAAGLDVTTPEPLETDSPLLSLPNCVILPHIGSASIETRHQLGLIAADNLLAGLSGNELPKQVPVS
ncbi:MAG: glyoxylate reductase/hydroxypyruvate reductase [Patescibacteria group bacterium]|nr:D-glycerate dehydrogenase [Candidatus Saccharibacteria bacterium]MDQ5963254.1 glyoxylate reductase/hydroxypyruvate reductase [Patescibacteria group bacterium]